MTTCSKPIDVRRQASGDEINHKERVFKTFINIETVEQEATITKGSTNR